MRLGTIPCTSNAQLIHNDQLIIEAKAYEDVKVYRELCFVVVG